MLRLYSYFRSSAAYRVRIALALKGLPYECVPVHLLHDGGMQHAPSFVQINPARLVPVLEEDSCVFRQSLAIMEYLEETHPAPALLPADPIGRARVRAIALAIACDVHPLNNLRVLRRLESQFGMNSAQRTAWQANWIALGFSALEAELAVSPETGTYCHGNHPTLADCFLVPQIANAQRVKLPLVDFPTIERIGLACNELPAFAQSAPAAQPDAF